MINDAMLDSPSELAAADSGEMLAAIASSGAQMRIAQTSADRDALAQIGRDGKPRALIVAGMGGSGVSGDILSAVAGPSSSVPLTVERTHHLPGWVSPLDVVIAVSCSGSTEETLAVAAEAGRRGARLITIGAANSPIAAISENTHGAYHLSVDAQGRMPRASLWTLATPLLMVADALGITEVRDKDFDVAADLMDELSIECGPQRELIDNQAKALGLAVAESLPMVWGTGAIGRAVAGRFMAQLAENAKMPCVYGGLPEVGHNQIVTFDGIFARAENADDIFRDRVEDEAARRLKLVLLRDDAEHDAVKRRVTVIKRIVSERNLPMTEMTARGEHRLSRVASLVVPTDWASAYAAFAMGIDPSPIEPIVQLKAGLANQ